MTDTVYKTYKELEIMIIYNKVVRDKILEIIEASGETCEVKILDDRL